MTIYFQRYCRQEEINKNKTIKVYDRVWFSVPGTKKKTFLPVRCICCLSISNCNVFETSQIEKCCLNGQRVCIASADRNWWRKKKKKNGNTNEPIDQSASLHLIRHINDSKRRRRRRKQVPTADRHIQYIKRSCPMLAGRN